MTKRSKIYNKFDSRIMQKIVRWMPAAVAMHWTMQGILYADPTEKAFRVLVDLILTFVGTLIFVNWLPLPFALLLAFVVAHTVNFLTNAQLCALSRDYGLVNIEPHEFVKHVQGIKERAEKESSIKALMVCGGIGLERLHAGSDFDARIIRHPGFLNGLRAAFFLMQERSRALWHWFPLDMYLFDNEQSLSRKLKKDEIISELNANTLRTYAEKSV